MLALAAAAFVPGCGDDDVKFGGNGGNGGDNPFDDEFVPAPGGMRKLMASEYQRSIAYLLGANAAAVALPPSDTASDGYDAIGASDLALATSHIEQYEASAEAVAEAAIDNPATMTATAPCIASGQASQSCFEEIAENLGRLFFRRPLSDEEVTTLSGVGTFAAGWAPDEGLDPFEQGLKYELMALLQSPSFLYIPLLGEEAADGSGFWKLDGYEIASRLSFFLLGRTPDEALLDAAEAGELDEEDGIRAWAEAVLESSDAWSGLIPFYDELFRLRHLPTTPKDTMVFPTWTDDLKNALREESLLFLQDVLWKSDDDMRRMYDAPYTFMNDALAQHYGLPAVGSPTNFVKVEWPAAQRRAGIFGLGAFMAHQSPQTRNSPSKRGKFVVQFALCKVVPPPPNNVVPELPDIEGTLQEQLEAHMEVEECATCHGVMDPPGFAFEHFDSIGRFRTRDEANRPIDGSGALEWLGEWNDAAELGDVVAEAEDAPRCIVRNFIRGRLGHYETDGEEPALDEVGTAFEEAGFRLRPLLAEITANRLFRYVGDAK